MPKLPSFIPRATLPSLSTHTKCIDVIILRIKTNDNFSNVFVAIRKKKPPYGLGGVMPPSPSSLLLLLLLPPLVLLLLWATGDGRRETGWSAWWGGVL